MTDLNKMECEVCRVGAPLASDSEIDDYMAQLQGWSISIAAAGVKHLERVFKFKNFAEAMEFTNAVGALAEENGHHPAILTEWGKVTVTYWTHKIKGLHLSDFVMAKKTDEVWGNRAGG